MWEVMEWVQVWMCESLLEWGCRVCFAFLCDRYICLRWCVFCWDCKVHRDDWYRNTPSIVSKTIIFVRGSWEPIRMVKLSFLFRESLGHAETTIYFFRGCDVRSAECGVGEFTRDACQPGVGRMEDMLRIHFQNCCLCTLRENRYEWAESMRSVGNIVFRSTIRKDCWLWKQHIGSNTREHTWCIVRSRN